jgi:hypothetical protein
MLSAIIFIIEMVKPFSDSYIIQDYDVSALRHSIINYGRRTIVSSAPSINSNPNTSNKIPIDGIIATYLLIVYIIL